MGVEIILRRRRFRRKKRLGVLRRPILKNNISIVLLGIIVLGLVILILPVWGIFAAIGAVLIILGWKLYVD